MAQVTTRSLIHSRIAQLPRLHKFPLPLFIAMTVLPASIVGALLWYFAGMLPSCEISIRERLTAPDQSFDLVVFERQCGASGGPNTQAALIPTGEDLPEDAASFVSVAAETDFAPQWEGADTIVLSLPAGENILRQDNSVAGVRVVYR